MRYLEFLSYVSVGIALQCGIACAQSTVQTQSVKPARPVAISVQVGADIHSPVTVDAPLNRTIPPGVPVFKGFPPPGQLSGPLSGIGNDLSDHGVHVGILVDDFFLHDIQTGRTPNVSMNSGDIKYSVTLDLDRILGIPNTTLNIDETQYILSHHAFGYVFDLIHQKNSPNLYFYETVVPILLLI